MWAPPGRRGRGLGRTHTSRRPPSSELQLVPTIFLMQAAPTALGRHAAGAVQSSSGHSVIAV
jgi:hypothetical protein